MAYIERESLINNLKKFASLHLTTLIINLIQKQPAADVVEVVRCGQCGNYCKNTGECNLCGIHPNEKDFCSYGVKKDCTDNKPVTHFDCFKANIANMSIDETAKIISGSDNCEKYCIFTKDGVCDSCSDADVCEVGVKQWLEREISE